jgi:hypothetical protein
MSDVNSKALLVSLRISTWSARKLDREVTRTTNQQHEADRDAGRYNKLLIPKAQSYKDLISVSQAARISHYFQTLAWNDEGYRLLPSKNYFDYNESIRKHRTEFEEALDTFLREYPLLIEAAKGTLGTMFRASDYPTVNQIARKFDFRVDFSPLPARGDFRLDLPSDQLDKIEEETQNRINSAIDDAVKSAWERMSETVGRVKERLVDPENIFRDSLIGNVRELCDIMTRLNVTDNPDLEAMRRKVEMEISRLDPQSLRDDKNLRADTARKADEILKAMSPFMGGGNN